MPNEINPYEAPQTELSPSETALRKPRNPLRHALLDGFLIDSIIGLLIMLALPAVRSSKTAPTTGSFALGLMVGLLIHFAIVAVILLSLAINKRKATTFELLAIRWGAIPLTVLAVAIINAI